MIAGSFPPLPQLCKRGSCHCAIHLDLQLKSQSLQRFASALHDFLSGCAGSREGDLVDIWVRCHPWAEIVVSTDNVHNTRREEVLGQLDNLEVTVRGEWPVISFVSSLRSTER